MRYSNPLELHPVALRCPDVRFVVPHFGAGLFKETLMLADLCPNVYLDTSSSNRWRLYEALELRTVFERCLNLLGPSRLLFGTDSSFFPRGWQRDVFDQQVAAMEAAGLNGGGATQVLGGNLERVLRRQ
jgi:predicted TIM-barrel fold metal-dependent hydrolase